MGEEFLGWPVVSDKNCFDVIRGLGIKPWPLRFGPEHLGDFLKKAFPEEIGAFDRFGPKSYFLKYADPRSGKTDNYFRTVFRPSVVVFALIEGYVPVTAEWKHGNDKITIVPVAGVSGRQEEHILPLQKQMVATGFREWKEETGTELRRLTPLCPASGIYSAVRPAQIQYFPFLGEVQEPIEKGATKYDDNEHIAMIVFPLEEWLALIESPWLWNDNPEFGLEMCARDVTYAALRKLGRLRLE